MILFLLRLREKNFGIGGLFRLDGKKLHTGWIRFGFTRSLFLPIASIHKGAHLHP